MQDHLDVRVDLGDRLLGGLGLGLADVGDAVDDLALQVRLVDRVEVHDAERADARRGQIEQGRRAEAARAHDENLRVLQALLPGHAHVGDNQVARVALHLVDRQIRGRFNERWQRHCANSSQVEVSSSGVNRVPPPGIPVLVHHLTEPGGDQIRPLHLPYVPDAREHLDLGVPEGARGRDGQRRAHQPIVAAEEHQRRRLDPLGRPPQRQRPGRQRLARPAFARRRPAWPRRSRARRACAARPPPARTGRGAGRPGRSSRCCTRLPPGSRPAPAPSGAPARRRRRAA